MYAFSSCWLFPNSVFKFARTCFKFKLFLVCMSPHLQFEFNGFVLSCSLFNNCFAPLNCHHRQRHLFVSHFVCLFVSFRRLFPHSELSRAGFSSHTYTATQFNSACCAHLQSTYLVINFEVCPEYTSIVITFCCTREHSFQMNQTIKEREKKRVKGGEKKKKIGRKKKEGRRRKREKRKRFLCPSARATHSPSTTRARGPGGG